tara:strand:- start:101 stop:313 length:213 start_codon:yes stop_codon:yes gene_type:complete
MKLEDLTVESIAQMTQEQRDVFVSTFVKKWPHLALDIADQIKVIRMDNIMEEMAEVHAMKTAAENGTKIW